MAKTHYPTSIRLTHEAKQALLKEAKERRWSFSVLVQHICDEWIKWRKRQLAEKKS